ncbi:polysaccharide biosynthesis/export family protein [Pirellulales bacterium]|nr:polysaccharide biosynthesis/export family protein [Pirellulales bacterium]
MKSLPTYTVEPPDVLLIEITDGSSQKSPLQSKQHLVGPDGNINLGTYGQVYVAGKTLREVQDAVAVAVAEDVSSPKVVADVLVYNSKFYYVVTQGGNSVTRQPITGNETVLDAIANMGGLPTGGASKLWISRPHPLSGHAQKLPIAWDDITRGSSTNTNYQIMPGDRLFIAQQPVSTNK